MDKSQVKQIVGMNLERLKQEFGIGHWHIEIFFKNLEKSRATCDTHILGSYDRAEITFNFESYESEFQLLNDLEHELLHIVAFPMNQYSETIDNVLPNIEGLKNLDIELFRHQNEQLIRALERLVANVREASKPSGILTVTDGKNHA
jgi:hypothetical protein